jgi:hypothetical protein
MAVGSERGTTNLDVLAVDQLYVAGTITGSVQNMGTETSASEVLTAISCPGTTTGSEGVFTNMSIKGTTTGSVGRYTNIETKGTIIGSKLAVGTLSYSVVGDLDVTGSVTGTYLVGSYVDTASLTGSVINVKGTITGSVINATTAGIKGTATGSFFKGTHDGAYVGSTVTTSAMLIYNSGQTKLTGATPGTFIHGLGGIPNVVLVTPVAGVGTGVYGIPPQVDNIGSAWFTVTAGTTGTVIAYALI